MARRATAIKQEREANPGIVLLLDSGNCLMGHWVSVQSKGRVIVEAMSAMQYDAMSLGQADFALTLEEIKEREAEASFPFLSANAVSIQNGEPWVEPYTILERQGIRFGILGLSEPRAAEYPNLQGRITVPDPVEIARSYVSALDDKVDVLIVLSHLSLEEDMALARAVPGIDVIVGGGSSMLMQEPERVGDTLIIQQGSRGEWLGRLEVAYDARGSLERYETQYITLGPNFADDPEVAALIDKWRALYPSPTPPPTPTLSPQK